MWVRAKRGEKKNSDDYQVSSRTGLMARLSSLLRPVKVAWTERVRHEEVHESVLINTTKLRKAARFPQRAEVVRVCVS